MMSENRADSIVCLEKLELTLGSGASQVNVLKGIDLAIAAGETVGIVGPSGSGKTSLILVIAGLETASGGRLTVAGRDLAAMDEDALAAFRRDNIGIVFQSFHLVPTMTALENVAVPLEFAGADDAFARAEKELAAVGLGDRVEHYPGQLSGGEQQRVALARALAPQPKILLADEPTGNLDSDTGRQIIELMFSRAAEKQATLLLITHDEKLAARCGRIVQLRDGLITADGAPAQRAAE
jgi:putative ABC transport system ATP-binding protein